MKLPCARSGWVAALAATLVTLAACERREAPPAVAPAPASGASDMHSAVKPDSGTLPASAAHGPADGATAIGGMAANQGAAPAGTGNTPAPTGGDGAASAPAMAASK